MFKKAYYRKIPCLFNEETLWNKSNSIILTNVWGQLIIVKNVKEIMLLGIKITIIYAFGVYKKKIKFKKHIINLK